MINNGFYAKSETFGGNGRRTPYNELYVTNFTSGTISVVDATKYSITREFNMPVYPNQMVLSGDMDTLYIGIKEGFNRDWDPDVFVEGAKERILSIDLKKS